MNPFRRNDCVGEDYNWNCKISSALPTKPALDLLAEGMRSETEK